MTVAVLLAASITLLVYMARSPRPAPVVLPVFATISLIAVYEAALAGERWYATVHLVTGLGFMFLAGWKLTRPRQGD